MVDLGQPPDRLDNLTCKRYDCAMQNWRVEGYSPSRGWEDTEVRLYNLTWEQAVEKLVDFTRSTGWPKLRIGPQ